MNKKSITLVIPTYTISEDLETMALACVESHKDVVEKVIISEDGGRYSKKLREVSDIYIYSRENTGFTKNVNRGWVLSDTDFTIIANSDTMLESGNLVDMCTEHVTTPEVSNQKNKPAMGCYFMVPRAIKREFGKLDETLKYFASDDDYFKRVKELLRVEGRVKIYHHKRSTINSMENDMKEEALLDSQTYRGIITKDYPERINWK